MRNYLKDMTSIFNFCENHKEFVESVKDNTRICLVTGDNTLDIDIVLTNGINITIHNTYYRVNNEKKFLYDSVSEILEHLEKLNETTKICDVSLDRSQLETIYNFYIQKTIAKINIDMYNEIMENVRIKKIYLDEFIEDIKNCQITISIFKTFKDLVHYLFVEGLDEEEVTKNILHLISSGFSIENRDNILKLGNMYVLIDL